MVYNKNQIINNDNGDLKNCNISRCDIVLEYL